MNTLGARGNMERDAVTAEGKRDIKTTVINIQTLTFLFIS